jgi:radical SAM superfamily enzyme YgiQ (UPF0313 family)
MRRRGEVLLISCYELGHQPLGLASPLGFLKRAGFAPDCLDISVEPFDAEKVARARFVGVSVPMHTALRLGVLAAERVREINPSCHVCFYGLYASLNEQYLLERVADSVVGGEFEQSLTALILGLEKESAADGLLNSDSSLPPGVEGVSLRGQFNPPSLKRLPFAVPSRGSLPPLRRYARIEREGAKGLAGYVEASRGCRHRCLHCPIPAVYDGRFFVVPQEVVLEDIRQLVRAGVTHVTFGDPDFLNGPGHSLRLARAVHREFPELTFDFTAKVGHLLRHRATLSEVAGLGCLFVVSAFESLSDTVLANLDKGHSGDDIRTVLGMFRELGMTLRPTWVPFTPWASLDDYLEMLECVKAEGLVGNVDPVQYTIRLLIPPGSKLLRRQAVEPFLGALDRARLTYRWTHPDPRMDELHERVCDAVGGLTQEGAASADIFNRVCGLASAAHGSRAPSLVPPELPGARVTVPRLTEPWFC